MDHSTCIDFPCPDSEPQKLVGSKRFRAAQQRERAIDQACGEYA